MGIANCAHCGKEFEQKNTTRKKKYCSEECRVKAMNAKHSYKSRKARFERDPEYHAQYVAKSNACKKRKIEEDPEYHEKLLSHYRQKRADKKEECVIKLVRELWEAQSESEVRAIVEKYTRIKAEFYR